MLSPPAVIFPFYSGVLTLNQFLGYEMHDQFSVLSASLIAAILGGGGGVRGRQTHKQPTKISIKERIDRVRTHIWNRDVV